mgnify:FL=1
MSVPFCWADKRVLERIRQRAGEVASALAVYHALTVAASDARAEEFTVSHAYIATLCGFSTRTVQDRLRELEKLGVVQITTPPLKAPSTFRLLAYSSGNTSGNDCRTLSNDCRTFGNGEAIPLPTCTNNIRRKEREGRPRTTADRIALEKRLVILQRKVKTLEADTSEAWQRQEHPERVAELKKLRGQIEAIEEALL